MYKELIEVLATILAGIIRITWSVVIFSAAIKVLFFL